MSKLSEQTKVNCIAGHYSPWVYTKGSYGQFHLAKYRFKVMSHVFNICVSLLLSVQDANNKPLKINTRESYGITEWHRIMTLRNH